jgi:hypothetical protein
MESLYYPLLVWSQNTEILELRPRMTTGRTKTGQLVALKGETPACRGFFIYLLT